MNGLTSLFAAVLGLASGAAVAGAVVTPDGASNGGTVVEYPTSSGDDPGRTTTAPGRTKNPATGDRQDERGSVQLITGGDSDEGSAKVGRLPVLD